MKHDVIQRHDEPVTIARVREITTNDVWQWLARGWQDLERAPVQSLFYGVSLTLLSLSLSTLVILTGSFYLLPLLIAGFMLVAPLFGIGPYVLSRQLERGEKPSFAAVIAAYRGNSFHLLNMGMVLMVFFLAWAMLANLLFIFFQSGPAPTTWLSFLSSLLGRWEGIQLLVAGVYLGGLIALAVFSVSVISVPMLMDRKVNVFNAIQTSWSAVKCNIAPMLLWAGLLVSIISIGIFTLYLGLIIGFPLAAHATWHAYRDLVES